jgi:superfamily II DNA or RNA helicase
MATGTGKTITFAAVICDLFRQGERVLVLAHREELLEQTADKLQLAAPWISPYVAITQGARQDRAHPVVIASVQTIAKPHRLERYEPGYFGAVIIDEAHHATAPTYRQIIQKLAPPRVLGVTASARRGDAIGLDTVFEAVAYSYPLRRAVDDGYLADIRQLLVQTNADLDDVPLRERDLVAKELAKRIDTPERNRLVAESWMRHGEHRKAIAFCVDVAHAQHLAQAFQDFGVEAGWAYGDLGRRERKKVLQDFQAGRLRVLCNCALYTEGFDDPPTACVLMCRPTASISLYEQMVGRGTRLHPGKADLLVIDYVDNCLRHKLVQVHDILGLPLEAMERGERSTEARQNWQAEQEAREERRQELISAYKAKPLQYRLIGLDPWDPGSVISLVDYVPGRQGPIDKAATERQREQLRFRGLEEHVIRSLTRDEASHLISQVAELEDWQDRPRRTERRLRAEINRYVGRAEVVYQLPDGTINRKAYAQFGKPRRYMNEGELAAAMAWIRERYPLPEEVARCL